MRPSRSPRALRALVLLLVTLTVAACSIGEVTRETVTIPLRAKSEKVTCDSPFAKVELDDLTPCGDGGGHCYDAKKVQFTKTDLAPCDAEGQVCVPDKVLSAGGSKLKSCTFFIGDKPGVCMSALVKDIGLHKNELQQDVCDADERCTPCVNPLDGTDTGLCEELGAHEDDCTGSAGEDVAPCCHGMGVCMQEDSTPEDQRGSMIKDVCSAKTLCAPAAMVDGNPTKCSVLGFFSGVCLDLCFSKMLEGMKAVARAGCGPTEICLPCAIGKGQGVVGCD